MMGTNDDADFQPSTTPAQKRKRPSSESVRHNPARGRSHNDPEDEATRERQSDPVTPGGKRSKSSRKADPKNKAKTPMLKQQSSISNHDGLRQPKLTDLFASGDNFATVCPVCMLKLKGFDQLAVESHVNRCLDGTFEPDSPAEMSVMEAEFAVEPPIHSLNSTLSLDTPENLYDKAEETDDGGTILRTESSIIEERAMLLTEESLMVDDDDQQRINETDSKSSDTKNSYWGRGKDCPWYKKLPDTTFTVDAFCYGAIPGCTAYFLSHFHSDHYGGLSSKFTHGPIYCSQVTANLVRQQLSVDPKYLQPLPLNTSVTVQGVQVTLIDANHCPGASLILFEIPLDTSTKVKRYLHTGDFRVHRDLHLNHPLLPKIGSPEPPLDIIYLDTTYCNPSYTFPPQDAIIRAAVKLAVAVCKEGKTVKEVVGAAPGDGKAAAKFGKGWESAVGLMKSWLGVRKADPAPPAPPVNKDFPRTLIVVGTYSIGKEKIFKAIANALNTKVFVESSKARILRCLEDEELDKMLTKDMKEAGVHVLPLGNLNLEALGTRLDLVSKSFDQILAIRPTGWTYRRGNAGVSNKDVLDDDETWTNSLLKQLKPNNLTPKITVVGIPYSEHSSFTELRQFVTTINAHRIIPTVSVQKAKEMGELFERWHRGEVE